MTIDGFVDVLGEATSSGEETFTPARAFRSGIDDVPQVSETVVTTCDPNR
ncbi:MAG TPA: hypothetical protein VHC69_16155 [Polyangiaceae bacterium]|nr:hypothetical protein [Polyangiaceae bacterium]